MIPLVDLQIQYKQIKEEIDHALLSVITETAFVQSKYVKQFEQEFADYCGTKYCAGCNSGTDALFLSLKALGIGKNDEVIIPAMTFFATAESVIQTGAKPVLCDTDENGLIAPNKIVELINKNTKAIIPVHLYGNMADMETIMDIAEKNSIYVIEDGAQAHGAFCNYKKNKKKAGNIGHVSAFSFYPGKNLGAYGDAGAVVTNDEEIYNKIKLLRDHGRNEKYTHQISGYSSRLDGIQAAILSVKLKYLDRWNSARRKHARTYNSLLEVFKQIQRPQITRGSVFHLYVIKTAERDALFDFLKNNEIGAGIHYPIPLHLQPALNFLNYKQGNFPNSEKSADTVLSLPLFPEMSNEQITTVANKIAEFYEKK